MIFATMARLRARCRRSGRGLAERTRGAWALVGLVVLAGVGPTPAQAVGPASPSNQFGISPARRHVVGEPGSSLVPARVVNTTADSYHVTVLPVLLTQNLSGTFQFSTAPADVALAARYLTVSPAAFTLARDHAQTVSLHWDGVPAGSQGLVIGVIFRGVALHQNAPVQVVTQLLSVNFLRLPSATTIRGRFTALSAGQAAPRVLQITPRVQNDGNRSWAPSHPSIVIRDAAGGVVYRAPWIGDVVIPGAQRDFPIEVHKLLSAGHYTVEATMVFGRRQTIAGAFTLVGPNQLPTPHVAVPYFNVAGGVGSPAEVATRVVSDGTAPGAITLRITLSGTGGPALARHFTAATTLAYSDLPPGSVRRRFQRVGGDLVPGSYQATGTWTDAQGVDHTVQSAFTAAATKGVISRIWTWVTDHLAWLLILIAFVALVLILRRRQRRLEAELAEARAAATAAETRTPDDSVPT